MATVHQSWHTWCAVLVCVLEGKKNTGSSIGLTGCPTSCRTAICLCDCLWNAGVLPHLLITPAPNLSPHKMAHTEAQLTDAHSAASREANGGGGGVCLGTRPPPSLALWNDDDGLWYSDKRIVPLLRLTPVFPEYLHIKYQTGSGISNTGISTLQSYETRWCCSTS